MERRKFIKLKVVKVTEIAGAVVRAQRNFDVNAALAGGHACAPQPAGRGGDLREEVVHQVAKSRDYRTALTGENDIPRMKTDVAFWREPMHGGGYIAPGAPAKLAKERATT